jgi:hypothetical protein
VVEGGRGGLISVGWNGTYFNRSLKALEGAGEELEVAGREGGFF